MRAKHTPSKAQDDWTMCPYCRVSGGCDVIQVLDAWESSLLQNTHIEGQWQNNTENGIVATQCEHAQLSTIARIIEAGYSCPLCTGNFRLRWVETLGSEPEQAMPTEASSSECEHADDNGLCHCESGFKRCPDCHEWLGIDHARKYMTATNVVTECEHAHLSTISRVIELGIPCPLCPPII